VVSGRSSSSDRTEYITHCCNASRILIRPIRCLCFQHLEPPRMATSTSTVAGGSMNPPNTRRRPGRQPVSCAECRRSAFPPHPAPCLPTLFNSTFTLVRLKLRCDRKVIGIAFPRSTPVPIPYVVGFRYPARLVGNEDAPHCVPLVSIQCSRIRSRMTSNALRSYFPSKAQCPVARAGIKSLPFNQDPSINSDAMQLRAVVVADNEGMQLKIDTLTARVQELERALQDAQRSTSNSDDPMLEDSPASPSSAGPSSVENGSDRESRDSYGKGNASYSCLHSPTRFTGTLYLGPAGDARFFGPTARSDYLAHVRSAIFARFRQG
jgi:hypothetical protein